MNLTYIPLLQKQRELYDLPRGMERFQEYLAVMLDPETREMKLPLAALNPMAKEHVPALLDRYLEFNADSVAAQAVEQLANHWPDIQASFQVALVLADDAQGGWTNRYASEFYLRFNPADYLKRGWITGTLWSSENPSVEAVRAETLSAIFRTAYIEQFGFAKTLREMLAQEGYAMSNARCLTPTLSAEELEYTRAVLNPHLDSQDFPIVFACLFGDTAASSLGYDSLGLSERAGFALARHNALSNAEVNFA